MLIDTHTHLGRLRVADPGLAPDELIARMDDLGIDVAVVLAVEMPEELDYFVPTGQVLSWCAQYPDHLIPFCAVDPRHRYPGHFDPYPILREYRACGCRGFGENLTGLPVDDPMQRRVYEACARLHLPIVMHFDSYINRDGPGLPAFERLLSDYPELVFIAHGPHFWREISADVDVLAPNYPTGLVVPGGRVEELLTLYPNCMADLSAHSAYNALARDREHAVGFLERQREKLLFGTDLLAKTQEIAIAPLFRELPLTSGARDAIGWSNASRLLGLEAQEVGNAR